MIKILFGVVAIPMYSFVKTHLTVYLIKIWHITLCKSYLRHIFKGFLGRRTAFVVALRSQGNWRREGPLGTPLGLVHWKRASSPVEAGTAGYL